MVAVRVTRCCSWEPSEYSMKSSTSRMCSLVSQWVSRLESADGEDIPLHISRFFPRYQMQDRQATDVKTVYRLAEVAREALCFVYTGNC